MSGAVPPPAPRRLTLRGSDELERQLAAVLDEAAGAIAAVVPARDIVALVLHGGYGRGEGGVERSSGVDKPHNNLDLLLLTRGRPTPAQRERVDAALAPVAARAGIGVDAGLLEAAVLQRAPHLVMWHDMHHGHRTLLGDAGFLPSLTRFSGPDIEPWDVRNLLTNRASLLVIAEAALAARAPDEELRRSVIKHLMKAIIGYGDAYLFFQGRYDGSYAKKQANMRALAGVSPELRALYDEAIEFRFAPTYREALAARPDLLGALRSAAATLAPVHLDCERRRLRAPGLGWEGYLEAALRGSLLDGPLTPRTLAGRALRLVRGRRPSSPALSPLARLGLTVVDGRGWLSILLPFVLYEETQAARSVAARLLGASAPTRDALSRAYLRGWGRDGDSNFGPVAKKLGLKLDEPEEARS